MHFKQTDIILLLVAATATEYAYIRDGIYSSKYEVVAIRFIAIKINGATFRDSQTATFFFPLST